MAKGGASRLGPEYGFALCEVIEALNTAGNLPAVLNLMAEKSAVTLNAKASCVRFYNEEKRSVDIMAAHGILSDSLKRGSLPLDQSPIDKETMKGKVVKVRDVTKDGRWGQPEDAVAEGIRSAISVPLKVRDRVIGALQVYTSTEHEFGNDEARFLQALAGQSAMVINNIMLNEDLQRRLRDCAVLQRTALTISSSLKLQTVLDQIARTAAQTMGMKACSIRLLDEKRERLELVAAYGLSEKYLEKGPVELVKSLVDHEALQGRYIIIPDFGSDPRVQYPEEAREEGIHSVLCVPLAVKGESIGTIRVYSSEPHRFTEHEINFLSALSSHAAIAIENARLHEIALRSYQELAQEVWDKIDVWGFKKKE